VQDDDVSVVDAFLLHQIESIPHLEALLLLWRSQPKNWTLEDVSRGLFLTADATRAILNDLLRRTLISYDSADRGFFRYEPDPQRDKLMRSIEKVYREELIRVTKLIHSKPSTAVQAFARAFRLKKDDE
jgi:hypothetical protein